MPIGTPNKLYVKPPVLADFNAQGNFFYRPVVLFLEDISLAGLQAQLTQEVEAQGGDPSIYYVVKDIQYQTVYKPPSIRYSVMIHIEVAENL